VLTGVTIDMADMSDLVPTLAVIAPFATTATEITGVGFIRAKESDRLGDLSTELAKCGITSTVLADGIRIEPGFGAGAALDTHHDHRLAMAFGVLGMRLPGMRVHDPDVVTKSWPAFWSALEAMRDGETPVDR
jgi:3-phosphoshikimate 1-carboxyvinyltransferase